MADRTAADRQRRYRERKRAEQQKAVQAVTDPVTPPVTRDAVTPPPVGVPELGARGRRLWQQVSDEGGELKPGEQVLLEEACRAADRLDVIDRILRGDQESWMTFQAMNEDGSMVRVVLNNALAEVRQQQTTLARLLAELRQSRGGTVAAPARPASAAPTTAAPGGGGRAGGVTDLAARIAAKRGAQASG